MSSAAATVAGMFNKLLDRISVHITVGQFLWGLATMSGLGIGAWAGRATQWINAYGPIGWVLSGLFVAGIVLFFYYIYARVRKQLSIAKINEARTLQRTSINVLNDQFDNEIISVIDLFSFFHQILVRKHFRNCRFVGPMVLVMLNNDTLAHCQFADCNFVIVEDHDPIVGIVAFESSTFFQCQFDCVTFLLNRALARTMRDQVPPGQRPRFIGVSIDG
jgi:hypothetical protein